MNKYSFSTVTFAAQASVMFAFHLHHPDAPRCPVYCMDCHRPIVTTEYTGCGDCGRQGPAFCLVSCPMFMEPQPTEGAWH